jgi:release factor glutamine methyltransferase
MSLYQYIEEQLPQLNALMHAELLDLDRRLAELEPGERAVFLKRVAADVASGRPYAYCVGSAPFRDCELLVNESVLIPRPETEMMPDLVRKLWKQKNPGRSPQRILDIGTGSGCLAISLAKMFGEAAADLKTVAWDICPKALAVARQNAIKNKVEVIFKKVDVLGGIPSGVKPFDIIVSNPPYVGQSEVGGDLSDSVFKHEPHLALFAEDDGLAFYKRFADVFKELLPDHGAALVEHGHLQAGDVRGFFGSAFEVQSLDDLQNKPRFSAINRV